MCPALVATVEEKKLALQERENILWSGIGLRESGHTGLQQDLGFGEVGGFGGQIGIANVGFGGSKVGVLRARQVDGVVELILTTAHNGLRRTEGINGGGKCGYGCLGGGLISDTGAGARAYQRGGVNGVGTCQTGCTGRSAGLQADGQGKLRVAAAGEGN